MRTQQVTKPANPLRALVAAGSALLVATTLVACGNSDSETKSSSGNKSESSTKAAKAESGSAETITITDAQNRKVDVPKNPKKVVVTDFSVLRTLDDFGVEVAATVDPVALPDSLAKYKADDKRVGSLFEPNYEKIAAMKPDLIIIGGRSGKPEILKEMTNITPNVIDMTVRPKDPSKKFDLANQRITDLASIFGKEDEAKKRLDSIKKEMNELKEKASKSDGTAIMVQVTGAKVSAYGPGSRFGFVYDLFGFKAIDAPVDDKGSHGQEVSQELFAKYDPSVVFYLDRTKTIGRQGPAAKDTLSSKFVNNTKAAKNDKLIEVDGFSWYIATNAPSSMEQMIKDAKKAL